MLYRSIFDLVRDFLRRAFGGEDRVLAKYLKPDLLIVDDMGMKQLPKPSGEYLLEIIMRRYETRSTMMTSNRPLEDWGKLIGDVPRPRRSSTASCTMPRSSRSPATATGYATRAARMDQPTENDQPSKEKEETAPAKSAEPPSAE